MASKKEKQQKLKKLRPKVYQIYGIFNFKKEELVFVSLDYDEVELQFDMENYDENFDIVTVPISIH